MEIYNNKCERFKSLNWLDSELINNLKMRSSQVTVGPEHLDCDQVNIELRRRFSSRFPTQYDFEIFLSQSKAAGTVATDTDMHYEHVLDSLRRFDAANQAIYTNALELVLLDLMRLQASLYTRLNLIIAVSTSNSNLNRKYVGYFVSLAPCGILVDLECISWCLLIVLRIPTGEINILTISDSLCKKILIKKRIGKKKC